MSSNNNNKKKASAGGKGKNVKGKIFLILFIVYMFALVYAYFGKSFEAFNFPTDIKGIPFDKFAHFVMFLPFPFLAHGSFSGKRKWRNLLFVLIAGIVIGYAFELLQEKITTCRTTDPWDLVTNIASLTVATFIMSIIDLFKK